MDMQNVNLPLDNFEVLPDHKKIVEEAIKRLANDERVEGLYLSGSFAKGKPDVYSDLDIYILVSENEREQVIKDHQRLINDVGKVNVIFPATHMGDPNQIIVFYEEKIPIHVDYQYRIASELMPKAKDKNVAIVLDRNGEIAKWKEACNQVEENYSPTKDDLQYFEDRFWGWVWYTYSKIARGELWEARDAEEYLRNNVIIKLVYYKLGLFNEGNRRLEQKFPPEILSELEASLPKGHDKSSYAQSLDLLIKAYVKLFDEVKSKYNFEDVKYMDRDYFIRATNNL